MARKRLFEATPLRLRARVRCNHERKPGVKPAARSSGVARWLAAAGAAVFATLAYTYLTLPDVRPLAASNPATTAFIDLRAREAHDNGRAARRVQRWIGYGQISPHLKRAVLIAEDDAFWQHDGVDYVQLQQSIEVDWARGELVRGASTITQQLAKNLYLSPSKNPLRKLRELMIARRLEAELKKQRILELYLNVIEWGDGIYGVEAAAREYFGASAAVARTERVGAARRRHRQSATAEPGASDARSDPQTAAHPAQDGRRCRPRSSQLRECHDVLQRTVQLDT